MCSLHDPGQGVLFIIGPILLCFRFSDWVWVSLTGLGVLLFLDGELGLIGDRDKLSVFKSGRKIFIFVICSCAGVACLVILHIFILIILFPPI